MFQALTLSQAGPWAAARFIIVQSTTSTQNSGFFEAVLPQFTRASGISVLVVAVGTGQAIKNAGRCDGDVLVVHARAAEEAFVAQGLGTSRADLMYNDFVVVGPAGDPAAIAHVSDPAQALARIAAVRVPFVSRGDNSGTHKKEMSLWKRAGLDPATTRSTWYRETGSGMGATLNIAAAMGAYTLTDRATWESFANKAGLKVLVEGARALLNQYGIIPVSPKRCPNVRAEDARRFIGWMLSAAGRRAITAFKINGRQMFFVSPQ
ncbi:MAG: substrate-binding domain-containing protein [Alphaproteobacteria bacterium]